VNIKRRPGKGTGKTSLSGTREGAAGTGSSTERVGAYRKPEDRNLKRLVREELI
jgi:hypothetical protein